jgi:hypothetical protein
MRISRVDELILRNQLHIMYVLAAMTRQEEYAQKMQLNSNIGYTNQFLADATTK